MSALYKDVWCFSKYFECDKFRLFSMCNIPENQYLFEQVRFRETDIFLVILSWMHPLSWFKEARDVLEDYEINKDNLYLMCNTPQQVEDATSAGFKHCYFINRHYNIDYNRYHVEPNAEKLWDACIFGEQVDRNNQPLAFHLPSLFILDGLAKLNPNWKYPPHVKTNHQYWYTDGLGIQQTMRAAYTGLSLSDAESICYPMMEFLLNGVPVVTSECPSGRVEWCNEYNSIIIPNKDPETILEAVMRMKERVLAGKVDPARVRQEAIDKMEMFRDRFVSMVGEIFERFGVSNQSAHLFKTKFEQRFLYQSHWKDLNKTVALFR